MRKMVGFTLQDENMGGCMGTESCHFFCSWSGGKDSCLALYRSLKAGGKPRLLLTMLTENGERSRSHGLCIDLVRKQAAALKIPLVTRSASWDNYENVFISALDGFAADGIGSGVFGDIDIDDHRRWVEKVCRRAGIQPCFPLWKEKRKELLLEFINEGFKATIVAVRDGVLDRSFLGRVLDEDTVKEIEEAGVDASGEEGEFHTVVTDGPVFSFRIDLKPGEQYLYEGCWFQDVSV
jgi:diphthine-ammonia ligase